MPRRKLTLDPRFLMWEGSVLRYSQAGACKPLPGDSVFQRLKTAALHTYPGLHSALATTMLWCLSHPSLFEQVRHTKVHLLHHLDLCDSSLWCSYTHILVSQCFYSFSCHAQITPGGLPSFISWRKGFRNFERKAWGTPGVLKVFCLSSGRKNYNS